MAFSTGEVRLAPNHVIESYQRAYRMVHEHDAHIHHLFADWYHVNGETVHQLTLFREITRLRDLAQRQRLATTDRRIIQRLIAKLRGSI